MDKNTLKSFAIEARKELIDKIKVKARQYGIENDSIKNSKIVSSDSIVINGRPLSKDEKLQREKLIKKIGDINEKGEDGYRSVIEEVAYTWFNRFTALRFMEVNNYMPTRVRPLSSTTPESVEPDLLKEANNVELPVDKQKIYELKLNNDMESLFKYMIISQCNALNEILPFMFEKIGHYTELLLPDGLLNEGAFVRRLTDTNIIPEKDWAEVEIIGWLYQYYNSEKKQKIFDSEIKRGRYEIPFATQLFTPDWIVKYMVQNSLGRYWVESHPEHNELKKEWEFYLENPNPEPDLEEKLAPYINKELKVEDIKCFDPACGSGHILVYMFDVLYEIYEKCGYMNREIPRLIIENNLYGLDIDDRAYQLACFAVVMKGMKYNSRLLRSIEREGIKINIAAIQETNNLDEIDIAYIAGESSGENYDKVKNFIEQFRDAKIYGSLIKVEEFDKEFLEKRYDYISNNPVEHVEYQASKNKQVDELLENLIKQSDIMVKTYEILVSNPPYIGKRDMCEKLSGFIKENYENSKEDLFSVFMEYSFKKVYEYGHLGFMTPYVWMFISSYEKLRELIIDNKSVSSLVQLEYSAFTEATVPICTLTLRNYNLNMTGEFIRLTNFPGAEQQPIKVKESIDKPTVSYRYEVKTSEFKRIQGKPFSYWASEKVKNIFETAEPLGKIAEPKQGMATGENKRFLRLWYEVDINKIGFGCNDSEEANTTNCKWFPYNKGGDFRKWYGNSEWIVNWENDGYEIRSFVDDKGKLRSRPQNRQYYFKEGITWSDVSSSYFGVRYAEKGFIFDVKGSSMFPKKTYKIELILAILTSKIVSEFLKILNPTISFQVGDLKRLPIILPNKEVEEEIVNLAKENILICKEDWDFFEISWNFVKHPFIIFSTENRLIRDSFENWEQYKLNQFNKLKFNEEKLNKILINLYGLENECSEEIENKYVTIKMPNKENEVKSFISYAVGCMFGRYSLDQDGIVYAGGAFDSSKYKTFKADEDNIIPILVDSYFEDDIVNKFVEFIKATFGEQTLLENIKYIAEVLGKKSNETDREAIRRYFVNEFYKDHINRYKSTNKRNKAPIYMLFTSGKLQTFNCLVYMHRYDKTTLSRIRTDYLHELQDRLDIERKSLLDEIDGDYSTKEKNKAKKKLKDIDKQIDELKSYDEVLHHMADMQIKIDLDDGVAVNYEKFKGLLSNYK
ncbi:BREX-1 system adenine-specific DNA-methyltransferase PglX [Clostridium perfringens]|nr:BREX-1 system adenine-specific DNA-methyltransferase PglX [Clostridium perfringens]